MGLMDLGGHVSRFAARCMLESRGLASGKTMRDLRSKLSSEGGQGTTEYAILVGVIVVLAIVAITIFRPKLQELWDAITDGMASL